MPDSILLSTPLHPFSGRQGRARAGLGLDLERIHDARRSRQPKPKGAHGREVIFQCLLWVGEARTVVDGLDFHACAAAIFKPGHQQMPPAPPYFKMLRPSSDTTVAIIATSAVPNDSSSRLLN